MIGEKRQSLDNFYGTMWQNGDATEITIGTKDVFEPIGGMSNGSDVGFTFSDAQKLTCTEKGKYQVVWNICFEDGNIKTYSGGILINDSIQTNTVGCRQLGAVDVGSMGGNGIVTLDVGDIVELGIANNTDTSNPFIDSANMSLVRVQEDID